MSKLLEKKIISKTKEDSRFHTSEILPDFQARLKALHKTKKAVPDSTRSYVGMDAINATTHPGKYFVEFASSSSIHGLNHLVAPHRHPVEKFLAVLFIIGALICLIMLSIVFWNRYQNSATIITLQLDTDRETFLIPQPAIIACPVPNIEKDNISMVFEQYEVESTKETIEFFEFLSGVNYERMHETPEFDRVPSKKWLQILYDLRKQISLNTNHLMEASENWMITEMGICMAKGNVFAEYASFEYWMADNWTILPTPDEIPCYSPSDQNLAESINGQHEVLFGFMSPFEMLDYKSHEQMKMMYPRAVKTMNVQMSMIRTEVGTVQQYLTINQRKCKFPIDGGLKTWPIYTRYMCVMECRMKIIEKMCNCRPHFARPIHGIPICNAAQLRCIGAIKEDYLFLYDTPPESCRCLDSCDSLNYYLSEKSTAALDTVPTNLSVINIVVEIPKIIYSRTLSFGLSEFLTAVGGAAGLFLGASVLSFVEIFYYVTLRLCVYAKNVRARDKKKRTTTSS